MPGAISTSNSLMARRGDLTASSFGPHPVGKTGRQVGHIALRLMAAGPDLDRAARFRSFSLVRCSVAEKGAPAQTDDVAPPTKGPLGNSRHNRDNQISLPTDCPRTPELLIRVLAR